MVLGAIVNSRVAVKVAPLVTLKYKARAGSSAPSATVVVALASEPKEASVAYPKALPISSKLVFVFVPQVPEASPVVISSSLKLFTYVAILYSLSDFH